MADANERWSPRSTLIFLFSISALLWSVIIFGVTSCARGVGQHAVPAAVEVARG